MNPDFLLAASSMILNTGLILAAMFALYFLRRPKLQFSAAVADTGGGGGLLCENSGKKLSTGVGYLGISVCVILLVWVVDLIEIITLASRAFSFYYFLQALLALNFCYRDCPLESQMALWMRRLFISVAIILAYIIFFAIPAE